MVLEGVQYLHISSFQKQVSSNHDVFSLQGYQLWHCQHSYSPNY